MCRFFSYLAHSRTIRPFEQVFFSKQSRRLSRAPPALSRMNREEHVPVLRHRTYGMSGTGPCASCAYVIMKPFSAYAAYGKGVLARSDFPPMESMESRCGLVRRAHLPGIQLRGRLARGSPSYLRPGGALRHLVTRRLLVVRLPGRELRRDLCVPGS